jgi:hypothetical protein
VVRPGQGSCRKERGHQRARRGRRRRAGGTSWLKRRSGGGVDKVSRLIDSRSGPATADTDTAQQPCPRPPSRADALKSAWPSRFLLHSLVHKHTLRLSAAASGTFLISFKPARIGLVVASDSLQVATAQRFGQASHLGEADSLLLQAESRQSKPRFRREQFVPARLSSFRTQATSTIATVARMPILCPCKAKETPSIASQHPIVHSPFFRSHARFVLVNTKQPTPSARAFTDELRDIAVHCTL